MRDLPFLTGAHGKGPLLVLLFFVSATVVTVWGTWEGTLPASEEAVMAEMAREILVTGEGWRMHFDSEEVSGVSPLPLWFMAASYRLFGLNEFSARLPFVLFSVLTFFLTYLVGLECGGRAERGPIWINLSRATGLLSAIILAASPLFGRYAPHIFAAVPHAFFATLALLGLLCLPGRRSAYLLWALGLTGALFVSGSAGVALVVGAVVIGLLDPERRPLLGSGWFWVLTLLALAAGGYWIVWDSGGELQGSPLWSLFSGIARPRPDIIPALLGRIKDSWLLNLPWSIVLLVALLRSLFFVGSRERSDRALALYVVILFILLFVSDPYGTDRLIVLLPAAAVLSAREMTRWMSGADLEATVSKIWSFDQAMVSLFCLLMLLLLATPLRLHRVEVDPIKEIALVAAQHTESGERLLNLRQPRRIQGARMLFYGGRSLDRPFTEPEEVASALDRDPGAVVLSTFDDFRALSDSGAVEGDLHMIYRAGPLVLFSASEGHEKAPR